MKFHDSIEPAEIMAVFNELGKHKYSTRMYDGDVSIGFKPMGIHPRDIIDHLKKSDNPGTIKVMLDKDMKAVIIESTGENCKFVWADNGFAIENRVQLIPNMDLIVKGARKMEDEFEKVTLSDYDNGNRLTIVEKDLTTIKQAWVTNERGQPVYEVKRTPVEEIHYFGTKAEA